jgi:predicted short-subunit dehydrogenase-like oxidoreductase (DUF2520 family)
MSEHPSQRAGRLGVGIVGAGKVGVVLGAALAGAGHVITGLSAASEESLDRASALLPDVPVLEVPEVIRRSELVLITVPTDELRGLVAGLAELGAWQPGQLVLHTAAEFGTEALEPAQQAGAISIALHPAMVFTGTSLDLARLTESYVAVTSAAPVLPIGQALVVEMGAEPIVIEQADRAAYADAVGAATEFSSAIVRQATRHLESIGVSEPGRVLASLVRSSVDEALRVSGSAPTQPEDADARD